MGSFFQHHFPGSFPGLGWAAPTACSGPALVGRDAPSTVLSEPWLPWVWHVPAQAWVEGGLGVNAKHYVSCTLQQAAETSLSCSFFICEMGVNQSLPLEFAMRTEGDGCIYAFLQTDGPWGQWSMDLIGLGPV